MYGNVPFQKNLNRSDLKDANESDDWQEKVSGEKLQPLLVVLLVQGSHCHSLNLKFKSQVLLIFKITQQIL